jgi:ATP-dependent Clp protease ATP-binding subunit ClpB
LDEYRKYIEKDPALERRFQSVTVAEPDVEDTISILRGLKERYELHHGVKIRDGALVAAALLSDKYISDRFLPDKAIDLVDEAAAKLRTEIDSCPTAIDELERRSMRLEIERAALKKETDKDSRERLEILEKELAEVNAQIVTDQKELHVLKAEWTHLNDPNRIRQLGERYAHLKPVRAEQIISFSAIPFKSASSPAVSESGIIRVSYSTSANGN